MYATLQSFLRLAHLHLGLVKIPLSLMISISAIFGFILNNNQSAASIIMTAGGVFLLACGGSALNNYQDRKTDCLLNRTRHRPLPAGLLKPRQALIVSGFLIPSGLAVLYCIDGNMKLPGLGGLAILLYNGIYTPFKSRRFAGLVAGVLCGMLPPLIGWTAAGGNMLSVTIWTIMTIFALWQIPHFWLILLNHSADYRRSCIPNTIQSFSTRRVEKIVFIWILNFAVMLFVIPAGYLNSGHTIRWIVVIASISLILATVINILFRCGKENYHRLFTYLNGTIFFVMVIVISDRLIG